MTGGTSEKPSSGCPSAARMAHLPLGSHTAQGKDTIRAPSSATSRSASQRRSISPRNAVCHERQPRWLPPAREQSKLDTQPRTHFYQTRARPTLLLELGLDPYMCTCIIMQKRRLELQELSADTAASQGAYSARSEKDRQHRGVDSGRELEGLAAMHVSESSSPRNK
ncbi:hypothetical protein PHYPSEUDO_003407 [Phytophthora pseudosyringae]|uniref:Uncharacterized protein n=1 Tax=Phytophthora pseudosyringae TaxID=221518 RepID=A0A8T1WDJ0_9STRA|nr:hypothetical protein PHYPSEUDO_003407 [Phytophthora pseudosyringae]